MSAASKESPRQTPSLSEGTAVIKSFAERLPMTPGVYRMIAADGATLYVGKAKRLAARVTSYTRPHALPARLQLMISLTRDAAFVTAENEAAALMLEARMIKELRPRFNVMLRDGKTYAGLRIDSSHPFPRITKHRGAKTEQGHYFGPFPSGGAVTQAVKDIQRAFLLRPCKDSFFEGRIRPCLEFQIKRCSAPCTGEISREGYAVLVEEALKTLRGESAQVQRKLQRSMEAAAEALEYESALQYRNRIRALTSIQEQQGQAVEGMDDAHVTGFSMGGGLACVNVLFYRGGVQTGNCPLFFPAEDGSDPAELLEEALCRFYADIPPPALLLIPFALPAESEFGDFLSACKGSSVRVRHPEGGTYLLLTQRAGRDAETARSQRAALEARRTEKLTAAAELFGLEKPPVRIEIYDNSHISGAFPVGGMVVAGAEGFRKSEYRRFSIKTAPGDDDYAMMKETLSRRLKRLKITSPQYMPGVWPDLLLIDGGKGQLSAALETLKEEGCESIPCVGISKGRDRNAGREQFWQAGKEPFRLPENDSLLRYLQILRDEAHRYAIGSHVKRREKSMKTSRLEDIPGVGPKRRKALLAHFGSAQDVAEASPEALARADGVSPALAQAIYAFYHPE